MWRGSVAFTRTDDLFQTRDKPRCGRLKSNLASVKSPVCITHVNGAVAAAKLEFSTPRRRSGSKVAGETVRHDLWFNLASSPQDDCEQSRRDFCLGQANETAPISAGGGRREPAKKEARPLRSIYHCRRCCQCCSLSKSW